MSVQLREKMVPLFFIPVSLHPKGSVRVWVRHSYVTNWEMKTGMVRRPKAMPMKGKSKDWGYWVSEKKASGNLRGAQKHWKDLIWGRENIYFMRHHRMKRGQMKERYTEANSNPTSGQLSQDQEFPESNGLFHQQVTVPPQARLKRC